MIGHFLMSILDIPFSLITAKQLQSMELELLAFVIPFSIQKSQKNSNYNLSSNFDSRFENYVLTSKCMFIVRY